MPFSWQGALTRDPAPRAGGGPREAQYLYLRPHK